jgi:alpha-L-fucosidase 2
MTALLLELRKIATLISPPKKLRESCGVHLSMGFLCCVLFATAKGQSPAVGPLTLWYQQPAKDAMTEALPIGNGTFGGVVFGGVEKERVQLNVDSLWTGDDHDYGSYQTLGNLYLGFGLGSKAVVTCPSGQHAGSAAEEITSTVDGDDGSKWCVTTDGNPVVWQRQTSDAEAVTSYTLVSANDQPERDPKDWDFSGSMDGQAWTVLDAHRDETPFNNRKQAKSYTFSNSTAYPYYRFNFTANHGDPMFQLAEIALAGTLPGTNAPVIGDYRRELDLSNATECTSFTRDGIPYTREVFASHPDQVVAVRWSSPQSGAVSGTIELAGAHRETTSVDGNTLTFSGTLGNGLQYATIARVLNHGGTLTNVDDTLQVKGANDVVVLLVAGTDYVFDYSKHNKSGVAPHDALLAQLDAASAKSYDDLKASQIKDFQSLFNRVSLDLGKSTDDQLALPIDKRKVSAATTTDPELEALLFQYGRYLLISCSRPGGMPANLQGLWNDSNDPAWQCDYHANINVQMNYWPAETTNLGECALPLFDWMKCLLEPWRKNTLEEKEFALDSGSLRGWAVRTGVNPWGAGTFVWDKTANAWLCQHLWEHYAFGQDKDYLKDVAYPIIKETVEFWEDHLKELPDGRLVVPHGWSPEHGPTEDGVTYNQEIVWDLFTNYMDASDALGIDKDYRDKIAAMRDKLVAPEIGKWGQLKEWMEDIDDPNDHHRHTSHLFGVFPGRQISVAKTPDLAKAAKVSLDARGPTGDVREWSFAWRTALYARMHDPENAHAMLQNLLSDRNTCLNMFGLHPPMQMDGNFGISAAIAEMLVQSHEGEINLLPALSSAWPSGSVQGLRARGGFEVGIKWDNGTLTNATIKSITGTECRIRYKDKTVDEKIQPGASLSLTAANF